MRRTHRLRPQGLRLRGARRQSRQTAQAAAAAPMPKPTCPPVKARSLSADAMPPPPTGITSGRACPRTRGAASSNRGATPNARTAPPSTTCRGSGELQTRRPGLPLVEARSRPQSRPAGLQAHARRRRADRAGQGASSTRLASLGAPRASPRKTGAAPVMRQSSFPSGGNGGVRGGCRCSDTPTFASGGENPVVTRSRVGWHLPPSGRPRASPAET